MTDRELLELAAKAAGLQDFAWETSPFYSGLTRRNFEFGFELDTEHWNPLANDGDALRLAVKLRLLILPGGDCAGDKGSVIVDNYSDIDAVDEEFGDDPYAATRRAIVRAAAEIGKALP